MENSIVTPGRLTVMLPVVKPDVVWPDYEPIINKLESAATMEQRTQAMVKLSDLTDELGRQLVHNIYVRKGNKYLMNKNGTRLKPLAQIIFAKGMQRLASNESPEAIVSDLQTQLLLLKGPH